MREYDEMVIFKDQKGNIVKSIFSPKYEGKERYKKLNVIRRQLRHEYNTKIIMSFNSI